VYVDVLNSTVNQKDTIELFNVGTCKNIKNIQILKNIIII